MQTTSDLEGCPPCFPAAFADRARALPPACHQPSSFKVLILGPLSSGIASGSTRQTGGVLAMGQSTLYPLLYNLEAKGLVKSVWRAADSGRDRKYYRLTTKGKRKLATDTKQWQAVTAAMESLGVLTGSPATLVRLA